MAGAQCATFPILTPPISSTAKRTEPHLSATIALPSIPTRRKNYLRPKILKTLTRPDPSPKAPPLPQQAPQNPVIPIESPVTPSENDSNIELSSDQSDIIAGEGNKVEEFSMSETTPEDNGIVGTFSAKSVLKFGIFLVGVFVFQTIYYVLVLGNGNPDEENRKSKGLGLSKSNLGNVIYLDELQLDEKIEEIRAMAREARKQEKKESKGSVSNEDDVFDESPMPKDRIGIEKEVGERLVKLQRRLNSKREKLQGPYVNLGKQESVGDWSSKEGNGALVFKKKIKFKSEAKRSPKGFGGSEEHDESRRVKRGSGGVDRMAGNASVGNDGVELLDADSDENLGERDAQQSVSKTLEEEPKFLQNDGNHLEKGTGRVDRAKDTGDGAIEPRNGAVQRTRRGRSSEGVKSRKSGESGKKKLLLKKEIQETTVKAGDHVVLSGNGISRHKEAEKEPVVNKLSGKRSKNEIDPWWLDLPYVLVILMRRGSGCEGQGGLYTLKLNSQPQNQSDSSYTIAFEDRADANNFCFLLESFFEHLGDFSADIAPLPNKELREAMKLDKMKVIFLKKGQLQLYAGQPFEEVEMALRSLVKQD